MTYARARLWLGISGVGSLVVIASIAIFSGVTTDAFSNSETFGYQTVAQLAALVGFVMLWLLPIDFLGGYFLPRKFQKSDQSFSMWFNEYAKAALLQGALFVIFGSLIIFLGQKFGVLGGLIAISAGIALSVAVRAVGLFARRSTSFPQDKLSEAVTKGESWNLRAPEVVVMRHHDVGFTGGVIGLGKNSKVVIPESWLHFSVEQLATAIARRGIAISSGSYARGLIVAFLWNIGGFVLCTCIPGAGLTSVSALATTVCGFTIWSFIGLLTLPTVSRNASLAIDEKLISLGIPPEQIRAAASTMDQLQDGEPDRPPLIEAIFHPVPNVTSRNSKSSGGLAAWNVARTTLFFSWGCMGFLSRSVHCNVGRPELWTMLPTD
jgi:hypothetical protein